MKISIIIPTLNESLLLQRLLCGLNKIIDSQVEIIVVDGGSNDNTLEIASKYAHQVFVTEQGRATQMNYGAAFAKGEVLFFLHADSMLTTNAFQKLKEIVKESAYVGGAFRLQIDSNKLLLSIISQVVNLRSRFFHLVYGDQGIFVRKKNFLEIGKFLITPLMEDVEFYGRLRASGKTVILNEKILTSARRWEKEGILYATFRNWLLLIMYYMGIPAKQLEKLYLQVR
ncbi:MAG: TIGR04283 family arsenosugar biosynthesis glycosyltransferase [Nitrospinota bacterium]|nr:TIGR04283 family arsenosugar biosynthesis glycosyltransferase [Nitrospinota bacterium]HJN01935.1 TIGR04283 family arsenosugar biosynthesis glycosyltransferase [Nitrospinota bacterium]